MKDLFIMFYMHEQGPSPLKKMDTEKQSLRTLRFGLCAFPHTPELTTASLLPLQPKALSKDIPLCLEGSTGYSVTPEYPPWGLGMKEGK